MPPRRRGRRAAEPPARGHREVPPIIHGAVPDAASEPEVQGGQAPPAPPQPAEDRISRQLELLTQTVGALAEAFRAAQQARPPAPPPAPVPPPAPAPPPVQQAPQMAPPAPTPRQGDRRILNVGGVSIHDFRRLQTPE